MRRDFVALDEFQKWLWFSQNERLAYQMTVSAARSTIRFQTMIRKWFPADELTP